MKFGKKYTLFVETEAQRLLPECSNVEFKRFKKLLKRCPLHCAANDSSTSSAVLNLSVSGQDDASANSDDEFRPKLWSKSVEINESSCLACDGEFFPDLLKAVSSVVDCFTKSSRQLRNLHLATGPRRLLLRMKTKISPDTPNMMKVGNILVSYGCMNALAVRKILKKYDKVHGSLNGRAFQTKLQVMRAELLQSPWLIELGALAINLMDPKVPRTLCLADSTDTQFGQADQSIQTHQLEYWTCNFDSEKHTLSYVFPETVRLDFNLECPICLEVVFDPVALGCGHIFCRSCVCAAASVPAFRGVKAARRGDKCPICRQSGVYITAMYLDELAVLIKLRCEEYFNERKLEEREARLKEAKEFWEREAVAMLGF
ncbi:hypothetical protein Mapa_011684 [Marchantia paleacea]|nr:hypothetical protein Mapa_011684 [Marchantia paleacea]